MFKKTISVVVVLSSDRECCDSSKKRHCSFKNKRKNELTNQPTNNTFFWPPLKNKTTMRYEARVS